MSPIVAIMPDRFTWAIPKLEDLIIIPLEYRYYYSGDLNKIFQMPERNRHSLHNHIVFRAGEVFIVTDINE